MLSCRIYFIQVYISPSILSYISAFRNIYKKNPHKIYVFSFVFHFFFCTYFVCHYFFFVLFCCCFVLHLYFDIKVLKSTQIRLKTFYPQLVYNIISFSVSKHTVLLYTQIFFSRLFFVLFCFVYIVAARKAVSFI